MSKSSPRVGLGRARQNIVTVVSVAAILGVCGPGAKAFAGIVFEPYYSVGSTKAIKPQRSKGTETETVSQREEKGLRAGLSFYRLFKVDLSVGQSFHVSTATTSPIKDEYNDLDFTKELDSTTLGRQQKKKETQNRARFTLGIDPSFSIFILRLKAGVTANQRIVKLYEEDVLLSTLSPAPTYKPHAGVGAGVRFSPRMYALVEYGFYFYKFPKPEPFERELTITYGFSI